jgi:hypothetical protein
VRFSHQKRPKPDSLVLFSPKVDALNSRVSKLPRLGFGGSYVLPNAIGTCIKNHRHTVEVAFAGAKDGETSLVSPELLVAFPQVKKNYLQDVKES